MRQRIGVAWLLVVQFCVATCGATGPLLKVRPDDGAFARQLRKPERLYVVAAGSKAEEAAGAVSDAFKQDPDRVAFVVCKDCLSGSLEQHVIAESGGAVWLFAESNERFFCLLPETDGESQGGEFWTSSKSKSAKSSLGSLANPRDERLVSDRWPLATKVLHYSLSSDHTNFVQLLLQSVNEATMLHRRIDGRFDYYGTFASSASMNRFQQPLSGGECEEVHASKMTREMFENEYVLRSKPVIVKDAAKHWLKFANPDILQALAHRKLSKSRIGVKLAPRDPDDNYGYFECSEPISRWQAGETTPPRHVSDRLADRARVLARPAHVDANLGDLLEPLLSVDQGDHKSLFRLGEHFLNASKVSMFVEYMPMKDGLDEIVSLRDENPENPTSGLAPLLIVENLWLSGGKTVSCSHFDAYENVLVMLEGNKSFRLNNPESGTALKEGHLQEAFFSLAANGSVVRLGPSKTTSLVNTPLDEKDRTENLAKGRDVPGLGQELICNVQAGDAFFLPSWWWHSVVSESGPNRVNLAVNYWFKPLYTKPFPCASCKLRFDTNVAKELFRDL